VKISYSDVISSNVLGDRFSVSRKGGTEGNEWVHLKGAISMAVSELGCRKALGRPFSPPLHEWT